MSTMLKTAVIGLLSLFLQIAFAQIASAQTYVVGSDGGSISISNSGQAVWSMPVEVPKGINGVAPSLTLSFSSLGGNGSLGVGGSLSGLSSITRCGRTIYQDGYNQAPQLEQSDAYCLDGARLVLESGNYGSSGSLYRTEIETFQHVKALGGIAGKGPAYFEVTNRSGAKMIYGQSASAHDIDINSGAVMIWRVDQLIDSNTNTLNYHYDDVSGQGETQLIQITYGGNSAQGVADHLSVNLLYADRPDIMDGWGSGQYYTFTKRIYAIETKVDANVAKVYNIAYAQGAVTGASRVISVQQCAGNGDCYRPSHFERTPEVQNDWFASSLSLPASANNADGKPLGTLIDINNDGKTDWVSASINSAGTATIHTYLGDHTGWLENTNLTLPGALFDYQQHADGLAVGLLLDVNADGWPDYVKAYQTPSGQTLQTWRNTGGAFLRDTSLDLPVALVSLQADGTIHSQADIADLNADGLVDIVKSITDDNGSLRQTWMHRFQNGTHSWYISSAYQAPSIAIDYAQADKARILASLYDINADGLSDWVQSYQINGIETNSTWRNTGQGWQRDAQFDLPVALFNYDLATDGVAEYSLTDLNGDALLDISKAMTINGSGAFDSWINTGLGWQQDSAYNLPESMQIIASNGNAALLGGLIDLNGDGQPDFVQSYQTPSATVENFWLFDKDARSWYSSNAYDLPFINNQIRADGTSHSVAETADLDHDGFAELFNNQSGAVFTSANNTNHPGTLVRVVNPLGAVTELTYDISTNAQLYELAEQTPYPVIAYNVPVRVISTVSASNTNGNMISALHQYGKAKTDVLHQSGLGYQTHTLQDENTGVQIKTTFHQAYPFAGRLKASTKTLNGLALTTSDSEIQLLDITINGLTTQYPHPNSSEAQTYDLKGRLLKSTRSLSQIDNFGNNTFSQDEAYDANGALARRSTNTVEYKTPDLTRWLFGLPIRSSQSIFDPASNKTWTTESIATFAADGKPVNETLEPNSSQWVKKAYLYDGFGNRTSSTVTAANVTQPRTSSSTYTSDGRFPATVSNALGHTITTEFEATSDKPVWIEDANGITKEMLYDGFGTLVKETKTHQSNGATRGRQIVVPKWCAENTETNCPDNAVYFIAAFDDEGEAPEIAYYNLNGKELRKQTYGHEGKIIVVDTHYDQNGKVSKVSQPYFKDDQTPAWTHYEYDVLGREIKRTNAAGEVFITNYDGLEVYTSNPGNNQTGTQITHIINNLFGQAIESIDPDNNHTFFEYDGRGKLVQTTDSEGNVTTIEHDDVFGRKMAMDDPDLGAWSYEYDALGNLIAQTDAIGQRTTMQYDLLNRLIRRVDDEGGPKQEMTSWEFSEVKGNGQLIGGLNKVVSAGFERQFTYDDLSRVVQSTANIKGESFTQRTGYLGTEDKVDWIEYPSGLSVRNTYDEYGFPQTVEGITLDLDAYEQYQSASRQLNDLLRQFEAFKHDNLTVHQLAELEEHEREIRRYGKALGDFYADFEDNPDKKAHEDEAKRYTDLVDLVQDKLDEHGDWAQSYQTRRDTLYDLIKDELNRIKELQSLAKPHELAYDAAKIKHDEYLINVNYYLGKLITQNDKNNIVVGKINTQNDKIHTQNDKNNRLVDEINSLSNDISTHNGQVAAHIRAIFKEPKASDYVKYPKAMFNDLQCCTEYVYKNFVKELTNHSVEIDFHILKQVPYHIGRIEGFIDEIEGIERDLKSGEANLKSGEANLNLLFEELNRGKDALKPLQTAFDDWERKRKGEETKLIAASKQIKIYNDEITKLGTEIKDPLDRINDWLTPITQSHNNMVLSFNDRARTYVNEISKSTGSYAKREDLKSENFLKPFDQHLDYLRCLRDQTTKSMGACYAETLVHVLNDDGTVDTARQNSARGRVEDDTRVDLKQFWSNRRFFCPAYYGYNCAGKYDVQIKQLAKSMHIRQCARMSAEQKDNSNLSCDTSKWDDTYTANNKTYFRYPYLEPSVANISNSINTYYANLVTAHKGEIERLVTNATQNTYNTENNYADIVKLGGNLWQATPPEPVAEGDSDPREFVLLYKGDIQRLAYAQMDSRAREANRMLKYHQYELAQMLDQGSNGSSYDSLYLAIQDKAEEVERLYKEIDQAYALASDGGGFDDDDFEESKKIYWQAEDINANGQITQAKYGNGTTTHWGYDIFGRINAHDTIDTQGNTLVDNRYWYDAIGNLVSRDDEVGDVREDFTYDILNRLKQSNLSGAGAQYVTALGQNAVYYDYDALGNILYKSDIGGGGANGHYTYGQNQAGPHAVTSITSLGSFSYDNNGNQLSGNGRENVYNAHNKPTRIYQNGQTIEMAYGSERQLIQQIQDTTSGQETIRYVGGLFEQISLLGGTITNRHRIAVSGNTIAIVDTQSGSLVMTQEHYLHKNHQSSVIAITDGAGAVVERRYYDAFGDIKHHVGQSSQVFAPWVKANITDISFTGHRALGVASVIHMNGRVYDAKIGRFMSADPHIQSPLNSQSLNRYSYVNNNPLSLVDPSGYFFGSLFKALKKLFDKIKKIIARVLKVIQKVVKVIGKTFKKIGKFVKKYARVVVAVAVAIAAPYAIAVIKGVYVAGMSIAAATSAIGASGVIAAGALGGGLAGLVATGSLKGALIGALTGATFAGIGNAFATGGRFAQSGSKLVNVGAHVGRNVANSLTTAGRILKVGLHGLAGGMSTVLSGGKFLAGFTSAGFTQAFAAPIGNLQTSGGRILAAGVVGGGAAELAGGKFKDGFVTGVYSRAFNEELHGRISKNKSRASYGIFRSKNHKYIFGTVEEGWMQAGSPAAKYLEDNFPFAHPIAARHDVMVDYFMESYGSTFNQANYPTMIPAGVLAVSLEILNIPTTLWNGGVEFINTVFDTDVSELPPPFPHNHE